MEEMGVDVLKPFKYKSFIPLYKWQWKIYRNSWYTTC